MILYVVLSYLPFENAFYSFATPEEAFAYKNPGVTNIDLVVEGQESAYVVGSKANKNRYSYFQKAKDGWKLDIGTVHKKVAIAVLDNGFVFVYQYKDSNDYYVEVIDTKGTITSVQDNKQSPFASYSTNEYITHYYAVITDFTEDYRLELNGAEIALEPMPSR